MKRIVPLLIFLLPVLSCNKAEPAPDGKDMAFVSIRAFETKSQIGTNTLPAWSEGDRISIVGDLSDTPAEFVLRSGAGYSSASFEGVKPEGNMFMAYYPSSARCDGITWRGLLSTRIRHATPSQFIGNLPLWGRGKDITSMEVSAVCGILRLDLKGSGKLDHIILEAGRPISGEYLVSLADGIFAIINGSNIIWVDAPETELMPLKATPFYFILPPAQYEELKITVVPAEGAAKEYILPDEIEIEAGVFTRISSDDLEEND
jgi:hypothetical protein